MNTERRETARKANFTQVELVARAEGGTVRRYPLILRDSSDAGLGGMYVGKQPLDPGADFFLCDTGGAEHPVRVVWIEQIADYVQMLGLEIVEST